MEKVVYIVGAGFSKPLGLPVMSDFMEMSKDMFFKDPVKWKSFRAVYSTVNSMHKAKTYFDADLLNIEEILSILEMQNQLKVTKEKTAFTDFITQVIRHYTPTTTPIDVKRLPGNWEDHIFYQRPRVWQYYAAFISGCLSIGFGLRSKSDRASHFWKRLSNDHAYSFISFNYDTVLEDICTFIQDSYGPFDPDITVSFSTADNPGIEERPHLVKLHGDASTGKIVGPTWNKTITKWLEPHWTLAHRLLSEANHIRIVGYSMPRSDAYFNYLLKAAVISNEHLKSIDMICLDRTGEVKANFHNLVQFKKGRFIDANVSEYLKKVHDRPTDINDNELKIRTYNKIETVHNDFMNQETGRAIT